MVAATKFSFLLNQKRPFNRDTGGVSELIKHSEYQKHFPLQPTLPSHVDPQELNYDEEHNFYLIPEGVRPVLKTFRIEVRGHTWTHIVC